MSTTDEQKEYAKGYAAGRKRGQADAVRIAKENERDRIRRAAYLAVAPAIIQSNWDRKKEGETSSAKTKMSCVDAFVDELMKRI